MGKIKEDESYFTEYEIDLCARLGESESHIKAYDAMKEITDLLEDLDRPKVYDIRDLEPVRSGKYDWDVLRFYIKEIALTQEGEPIAHECNEEFDLKIEILIEKAPEVKLIGEHKFALYDDLDFLTSDNKAKSVAFLKKEFKGL